MAEVYIIQEIKIAKFAIMPRPRAGDWLADEAVSWSKQGLKTIVSLLEDSEIVELGLEAEQICCENAGMQFIRFPIPDRGVPTSIHSINELITKLHENLDLGRGVGIHCRFGIGRSSLIAACVLCKLGFGVKEAWSILEKSRKLNVPDTASQRIWVEDWFNASKR